MFFAKKSGAADWMIVGLGNPGLEYESTRHNAGFMVIDRLAEEHGAAVTRMKWRALSGTAQLGGHRCLLVKPQTYMNNSGEAVRDIAAFYKIPPERTIIIFDDISLDVGRVRIRRKGSDGGHNGMKSICLLCGSEAFPRIKVGIGAKPHPDYDLAKWVLSRFASDELAPLSYAVAHAAAAAELIVVGRTDEAMNKYN